MANEPLQAVLQQIRRMADLDQGEPRMTTDFRRVYATVLEDWLGLAARDVLTGQFERVALFRA